MSVADESTAVPAAEPITAVRITQLLQGGGHDVTVERITTERVGTGQMGASYRIGLTVSGDRGDLPDALVAKLADGPPEKRAIAAGSYRTEVDFYRNSASTVAVRIPHCWASWTNDDGSDVAAVDWQTISLGLPARDLAFLCSTGLDVDVRRTSEQSIVGAYHRALLGHGVDDYSLESCRDDYAYSMFQGPLIVVFGWAVADKTDRGDAMFLAMTERVCAAIRDHDTFARL